MTRDTLRQAQGDDKRRTKGENNENKPKTQQRRTRIIGAELDAVRAETLAKVGEEDAQYIRDIIELRRDHELLGRELLKGDGQNPASWLKGTWAPGRRKFSRTWKSATTLCGDMTSMKHPETHSQTYEWDTASTSDSWRHSHNYLHHTYTNVVGKDRDLGDGILRLTDDEPWKPQHLAQPISNTLLSLLAIRN